MVSFPLPSSLARRPDLLVTWGAVAGAWLVTLVLIGSGEGHGLVDHDAVFADRPFGWPLTIVLFLVSWQLMTAAMMLPASMPMIAMFRRVSARQDHPAIGFGTFLLGYFAVWTGFAVLALAGDGAVHWLVANVPLVGNRPWVIGGTILVMAGVFQFSSLKERCLDTCRDPITFFWRHYIVTSRSAWELGLQHGLFCLGCCWALMLTMFAVGMGSLVWMVALTGVMVIEKVTRYGNRLAGPVGVVLIAWGVVVILNPGWLPTALLGQQAS